MSTKIYFFGCRTHKKPFKFVNLQKYQSFIKMLQTYTILIIVFLLGFNLQAQEKWTLESCINHAITNNIQIKQQELNTKYYQNLERQSKFSILPNLNTGANQTYTFGRSIDPYTNEFSTDNFRSNNFSVNSSMTIFGGLQKINNVRKSNFDLQASIQDLQKAKNDIALNIAAAYLQVLYNEEMFKAAELQLGVTKLQHDKTQRLVEAGSLAKGSLLEVDAQIASEELQLINLENQLLISNLTLKQILDLDSVANFNIDKPIIENLDGKLIVYSVDQIFNEAITNLPQIKSAEYKVKSSEADLCSAKGGMSPRLSLNAGWGTGYSEARTKGQYVPTTVEIGYTESGESVFADSYSYVSENYPFSEQFKDNASTSLSFNLSIPIFNNWQVNTNISNAKISLLNSKLSLDLTKQQLYKEIQQAYADAIAAFRKYNAATKALASIQESFRYTQQKFDVGMVSSFDFNAAKNNLLKAESDVLQAKYEYVFKSKILDFYRGDTIKL